MPDTNTTGEPADAPRPPVTPDDPSSAGNDSPPDPAANAPDTDKSARSFGAPGRPFAKTSFHHGLYAGIGLIAAWVLYQSIDLVLPLLVVILVAGFLAVGLNPLVVRVQRFGLPRGLSVATVCLVVALVLCGGLVAIVPPIITESTAFINAIPDLADDLSHQQWLINLEERFNIVGSITQSVKELDTSMVLDAAGGIASVLGVAIDSVFNAVMIALLTVYFLVSFDRLKGGFYRLLPASRRPRAQVLGDEILTKVGGFTVGALAIAVTAGVTSFVFMLIAGVPYAYALAFIVALFDLIPQIGATLGAVLVTLVGLTESVWVAVACAIFFIVYQQVENWLVYPAVMRRSVKVSDLAAIIALLLGASLMGIVGALLAVPTVAAIQLIVREVYIPRQNAN